MQLPKIMSFYCQYYMAKHCRRLGTLFLHNCGFWFALFMNKMVLLSELERRSWQSKRFDLKLSYRLRTILGVVLSLLLVVSILGYGVTGNSSREYVVSCIFSPRPSLLYMDQRGLLLRLHDTLSINYSGVLVLISMPLDLASTLPLDNIRWLLGKLRKPGMGFSTFLDINWDFAPPLSRPITRNSKRNRLSDPDIVVSSFWIWFTPCLWSLLYIGICLCGTSKSLANMKLSSGLGWFFEWPGGRHPLNTTWPWADVKPSLVVLWGVCWMFAIDPRSRIRMPFNAQFRPGQNAYSTATNPQYAPTPQRTQYIPQPEPVRHYQGRPSFEATQRYSMWSFFSFATLLMFLFEMSWAHRRSRDIIFTLNVLDPKDVLWQNFRPSCFRLQGRYDAGYLFRYPRTVEHEELFISSEMTGFRQ